MNRYILFVLEGEETEKLIIKNLEKIFLNTDGNDNIKLYTSYKAEIFQLWEDIEDNYDLDDPIDLVTLLRNRGNNNLQNVVGSEITEIHLFFDHDAHSHLDIMSIHKYNDIISKMLAYFNDEYEHGKLWISYPMVEALKHFKKNTDICFENCIFDIMKNTEYKEIVGNVSEYKYIRSFSESDWYYFVSITIQKIHCLISDTYKIPEYTEIKDIHQSQIHEKQIEKFINPALKVAVISAFPLFILYYFGETIYKKAILQNTKKACGFSCFC